MGVEVMMDIHKISQTFDQFLSIKACIPPEEVAIATKAREIHVCKFVCFEVLSNATENDTNRQVL